MDPGLQLALEMAIASGIALLGLWKLKKRTDQRELKTKGNTEN